MANKIENILNLAQKLNAPVQVIDNNTIQLKKRVYQIMELANRTGIIVLIGQPEQETKSMATNLLPQIEQPSNGKVCFFCGKTIGTEDAGFSLKHNYFHLSCERQYREKEREANGYNIIKF